MAGLTYCDHMEEYELRNRLYSYLFYSASVVSLIISIFSYNLLFIALNSMLLLLSSVYLNSGHIINNILIKRSKIIEIYNGYSLSDDLVSVFKKVGKLFYSTSIALLFVEKNFDIKQGAVRTLLENIREPFEFSIVMREIDKKRMIESLEIRRNMKEINLRKLDQKLYDKINNLQREIDILDQEIKNIRTSGKAFDILLVLKVTVKSDNEFEAERGSIKNLEHVADIFSSSMNVNYCILKGEELLAFLEVQE